MKYLRQSLSNLNALITSRAERGEKLCGPFYAENAMDFPRIHLLLNLCNISINKRLEYIENIYNPKLDNVCG